MWKKTCVKQAYKYWPKTERLEKAIHFLNTETDEGFKPANAEPETNPELAAMWIEKAKACANQAELTEVWKQGAAALRDAKDMPSYERFKAEVGAIGAELKSNQEQ